MEQRRLRLGDILDDYCPRERRVTNHAVVAMIDEDVKQTRCTTCDAEHVYKGGKAPRRRKGEPTAPTVSGPTMSAHEEHNNGLDTDIVDEPIAAGAIIDPPAIIAAPPPITRGTSASAILFMVSSSLDEAVEPPERLFNGQHVDAGPTGAAGQGFECRGAHDRAGRLAIRHDAALR